MRDPKHPGQFAGEFRGQTVALVGSGKPRAEAMRGHDLGRSALDRRIRRARSSAFATARWPAARAGGTRARAS